MQLIPLGHDDLGWPATNSTHEYPSYSCGVGSYKRGFLVDPFPCYEHSKGLVEETLHKCVEKLPLKESAGQALYSLAHEFVGRNNGLTFEDSAYKRPDGSDWEEKIICHCGCGEPLKHVCGQAHTIVICGKRMPIMPSMTKYLITHEYGHAVFNHKRRLLGYTATEDEKLEIKYMNLRGVPAYKERPNERWHRLMSEIVANDFRTVVMETETDFWPHEVSRLNGNSPIAKWWTASTREEMEEVLKNGY